MEFNYSLGLWVHLTFSAIYTERNNFCAFIFASLGDLSPSKQMRSTLKSANLEVSA